MHGAAGVQRGEDLLGEHPLPADEETDEHRAARMALPRRAPRGVLVAILEGCLAARTPPATARTPPRAFPSEYPQKPLWRHALGHNSTRVADVHDT